ncbi:hypothetical protein HPB50_010827 [Hyalomma asiaticum]|uniref:Uncharacterized protein n=1 Tax=Hyalomma asiaticum TaxID=266040 RepID=A0ACB7RRG4_HYAAI|nr:hypothetical protein HPB50_010827 [Hyalomma asiaticum]
MRELGNSGSCPNATWDTTGQYPPTYPPSGNAATVIRLHSAPEESEKRLQADDSGRLWRRRLCPATAVTRSTCRTGDKRLRECAELELCSSSEQGSRALSLAFQQERRCQPGLTFTHQRWMRVDCCCRKHCWEPSALDNGSGGVINVPRRYMLDSPGSPVVSFSKARLCTIRCNPYLEHSIPRSTHCRTLDPELIHQESSNTFTKTVGEHSGDCDTASDNTS